MATLRASALGLLGIVLGAASGFAQPSPDYPPEPPPGVATDADGIAPEAPARETPVLMPAQVDAEAARLAAALRQALGREWKHTPRRDGIWISRAWEAFRAAGTAIERPQLVVVVDRNPRVQEMALVLARPDGPWEVIGGSRVSTGQAGRFDHYITPLGVFAHTDAILDYRAEGTFNENHIRGLGLKGMRVWDFGWQVAQKGWRDEQGQMRLLMHATDPANLARRIGRPASKGCIRVPAAMNRFLDRYGVLDADYERAAEVDPAYRALLLANRTPTPLAGDTLVVIDSSQQLGEAVAAAPRAVRALYEGDSVGR